MYHVTKTFRATKMFRTSVFFVCASHAMGQNSLGARSIIVNMWLHVIVRSRRFRPLFVAGIPEIAPFFNPSCKPRAFLNRNYYPVSCIRLLYTENHYRVALIFKTTHARALIHIARDNRVYFIKYGGTL